MPGVELRTATVDDVSAIVAIASRCWWTAYGDFLTPETVDAALGTWYDPDVVCGRIENDDVSVRVAVRDDGAVVGFSSGVEDDEGAVASLGALYVDPDSWRSGVGTALLDRYEDDRRRDGFDAVEVEVLAENDGGRQFYATRGYDLVEERRVDLFGESVGEAVYRTSLS